MSEQGSCRSVRIGSGFGGGSRGVPATEVPVKTTDRLRVTTLINNHNYGKYLGEAIDSALGQTYPSTEVVVVDDGSTDESAGIMQSYGSRIVPVFQSNTGQASAFNTGFAHSTGDIVCLLDADDVFEPTKAARIVKAYEKWPGIGWCHHPLALFGEVTETTVRPSGLRGPMACDYRRRLGQGRSPTRAPATSGLTFKRDVLGSILPMPEAIRIVADNYLKFASFGISKGYMIEDVLARQRIHSHNRFSLREDQLILGADVKLQTAASLRERFPDLSRFADRLFAKGVAELPRSARVEPKRRGSLEGYLASTTLLERLVIVARTIRYRARRKLGGTRRGARRSGRMTRAPVEAGLPE